MPATITLKCAHCDTAFEKRLANYKADLKRRGDQFYCSRKCVGQAKKARSTVDLTCTACGTGFQRLQSQMTEGQNHFCSLDCSTTYNNVHREREPTSKCRYCGDRFPTPRTNQRKVCPPCKVKHRRKPVMEMTKGELFSNRKSWQSARSSIQKEARKVYFAHHGDPHCIAVGCGYRKHVEVSHRRDVADFPDDSLISEINDLKNLAGLCPTHHWEFDHDALDKPLPEP